MNPIRSPLALLLFTCFLLTNSKNFATETVENNFNVAGQMGLMKFVIIPAEKQSDVEFHRNIVKKICIQGETCFLNFFTNSKNAPEDLPLDDRILAEPTLMYKYSPKHRNEIEDWSCRLKLPIKSCFCPNYINFERPTLSQMSYSLNPIPQL